MNTLLRSLALVAAVLMAAGCRSTGDDVPDQTLDEIVYTRVGMHFDTRRGRYLMYSTNYLGMPTYVPPGTQLTLTRMNGRGLSLRDGDGADYAIEFVSRHSMMPITEWKERHFSAAPVALPETLSEQDREGVRAGEIRRGMSREAVFLAVGYPPKSTNPSEQRDTLVYEWRRFVRRSVRFDDDDKVEQIGL